METEIIYFAGLFDGEGSLIIRFKKDERYRSGYQVSPWVNITQRNREVLEKMIKIFKMGKIYYHKRDKLWHMNIYGLDNLINFTKHILPYLIIKKEKCQNFLKSLEIMKERKHLDSDGLKNLMTLWNPDTEANAG